MGRDTPHDGVTQLSLVAHRAAMKFLHHCVPVFSKFFAGAPAAVQLPYLLLCCLNCTKLFLGAPVSPTLTCPS